MGGLLAFYSLRWASQFRAAWTALCASCNFWIFVLLVSSVLKWGGIFSVGLGYVWGHWLNRYISRKLPDVASYPPKSVLSPLLIALLLGMGLLFIKQALS
jgi:hypothetical protein